MRSTLRSATRRSMLLAAIAGLVAVHVAAPVAGQTRGGRGGKARSSGPAPAIVFGSGADGLPPAVADMRAAILAAVETGDIADLKEAMDLNELKPEVGAPVGADAIGYLKSLSADGTGKDVLADLGRLLEGTWAAVPGGRDVENNRIYVWPHFAEVPIAGLSEAEHAALELLAGAERAKSIREASRWTWWRLSIGADGVWHMLTRAD